MHSLGLKIKMLGLYLDYIKTKNVLIKCTYILYISMKLNDMDNNLRWSDQVYQVKKWDLWFSIV